MKLNIQQLQSVVLKDSEGRSAWLSEMFKDVKNEMSILALDVQAAREQAAIPQGDFPTVEEMLEKAKNDPSTRGAIEETLRGLEFEDPLVGFN